MSDFKERLAGLSPERQALFEALARRKGLSAPEVGMIPRRGAVSRLPLSFAQQRLWFLDQLSPGNPFYNEPLLVFRLSGRLNVAAFRRTLDEIVRRHESLRTTFPSPGGEPVQVIHPPSPVPVQLIDLSDQAAGEREEELKRLALAEARHSFDLTRGPLLRVSLIRVAAEENVFFLSWHHIITDGWSNRVLMREVSALYEAFCVGAPSPLAELPIQYADFALWQRRWLQGEALEGMLAYWKRQLGGELPALALPLDRPRPAAQTFRGARSTRLLPAALNDALKEVSRREGVTLFMTLLAAFLTVLHRHAGQEEVVIGTPVANRTRRETEGLIGFFVNTLVLRTDLSGNPTFRELLRRVREVAVGAYAHQDMPFERLVEALQPERDLSRQALFQVMFGLHNYPDEAFEMPGLKAEGAGPDQAELDVDAGESKFDLALSMSDLKAEGLKAQLDYSTDLFEEATIARLQDQFAATLRAVAARPETRIKGLRLPPGAGRKPDEEAFLSKLRNVRRNPAASGAG